MNKRVVITGASGHIGYHVALLLLELGYHPLLLIRRSNVNTDFLRKAGAEIAFADFQSAEEIQGLLYGTDVLFHLASENTIDACDEERVVNNTYGLTKMVIDAAVLQNVKTIIYTSSVVVFGRSKSSGVVIDETGKKVVGEIPYVKGKLLAENYCDTLVHQGTADIRRVYPSWVIGGHDQKLTPPNKVLKTYLEKGQWFYFQGGISISGVREVAQAHIDAWLTGRPNEKYITAGHNITFKELYTALATCTGYLKPFIPVPKWLVLAASIVAKALQLKDVPDPVYVRSIVGSYSWYSSEKAKKEIGYIIPELRLLLCNSVADLKNT